MEITEEQIKQTLRQVIDPEVGINIVDLGLIYGIEITDDSIHLEMTMTTRACPMGEMIREQAEAALRTAFPGAKSVDIKMVWSPPWNPDMMSEEARKKLS